MGNFVGVPPIFPQGPDPLEMWRNAYSQPSASQDDGKVQSLAQTYKADPEYVRDNLIDFQSRFAAQQLYSQTFQREYPTLSRNLVTPQFVSRVRDDMGNIIETEGWWNEISNAYNVARDTVAIGNIGTRAMLDGRDLYPYERRKIERARQLQRAHMQSEPGFLAAAAELAGTMQETLGYSLAAGYTAGAVSGPAAPVVAPIAAGVTAFATSFNLEAGNLYAELITDGYTPAQAADIATKYGAAIAGFEAVGLKLAGQPIKELGRELMKKQGRDLLRRETAGQITGRILRDYAVGIAGEATTEGIQEIISEFGKARASQIYRPENLYEPEYYETFTQAFTHTLKGMVVLGGVPSAVRLANDQIRTANANHDYEKAKQAAEIRGRSKAREAQRQVDSEAGETTTLNSSYYVRAQDFKSAITEMAEKTDVTEKQVRDTVEANSPGLMAKIDEAAERDGEVELTKTEFEDAFENTKFRETALLNTAFEENGLTVREVKESDLIRDKMLKERGEKAEQELQDMDEFERQLREVRQDVTRQLGEAMKGMDAQQTLSAAAYSSAIIGFIRRAALQQNITPQEFYNKHFPQIVQQRLGAGPVGPQALAAFAGSASNMTEAVKASFQQALKLAKKGKTPREVWSQTGWYVADDGRLIYEINDENVKVAEQTFGSIQPRVTGRALEPGGRVEGPYDRYVKLDQILLHPELYEAYPQLRDVSVSFASNLDEGVMAVVQGPDSYPGISVANIIISNETLRDGRLTEEHASYLMHEVQHIIQRIENRGVAGSSTTSIAGRNFRQMLLDLLARDVEDTFGSLPENASQEIVEGYGVTLGDAVLNLYRGMSFRTMSPKEQSNLRQAINAAIDGLDASVRQSAREAFSELDGYYNFAVQAEVDARSKTESRPDDQDAPEEFVYSGFSSLEEMVYIRSGGEVEARNVQRRLRMTEEERRQNFPSDTQDVPRSRILLASRSSGRSRIEVEDRPSPEGKVNLRAIRGRAERDRFIPPSPPSGQPPAPAPRPEALESGTFDQDADYTFTEGDYRPEVVAWAKEQFGDRVAPNGQPVYQNFVRWFGDSKVVDAEGKPLVVYHGTGRGFESFSRDAISRPGFGHGFHFAVGTGLANYYANQWDAKWMREQGLEASPRVIPAFLSIKNPASEQDYNDAKDQVSDVEDRFEREVKVREYLEQRGFDGIRYDDLLGARSGEKGVLVAFNSNQIKSTLQGRSDEYGDFSADPRILYSKEGEQRRVLGQAEVDGGNAIKKILLDPNAKPTTLMHELMHWNLELMATIGLDIEGKMAQEGYEATMLEAQMLGDIQRLLKWSGYKGTLTEWRAMTIDQRRKFHEAIAVSFERYLYEGVAPSRELRSVFSRLLSYIAGKFESLVKQFQADYQREFGRELPGLNDEVRAIFGRMMSAERDVQAFFAESELDAMMMTKKEWTDSGRDASEYDEYEQEFKDALNEATSELTMQRMKEVKTFANAYELVAQKQRGELARITKEIRQEVQAEVEVESVYQFVSWMRKGTYQSENGTVEPVKLPSSEKTKTSRKLNAAIVKAVAPDLYEKLKSRGLTSKNGVTLEKVRGMFGFESNRAMLEALAAHRNIKEEVLHRTNQRLLNEHTDLMDPVVQQENIHRAVHNKIRRRVVTRELKFLLNNGRRSRVELQAAKDIALALIERVATGDIDIAAYKRAAVRARKEALKALKDGDMQAAAIAKRKELVNEQMIEEGLKARKEVRSLVESNKRAFKHRTDKALAGAGYDVTVMKALRAVLASMGIGSVDFDINEALARFAKEDPEFAEEVGENIGHLLRLPISQPRVGDRRKPMEHLTLKDVRVLRLLSARMMLRAKNKLSAKIGEKKQRVEAAQGEAVSTLEKNVKPGMKDLDGKKSLFGKIRNYFSDLIRFEHLFRRADGGKVGIWTRMFRMIKDAGNRYRQEFKEFAEDFGNRLRALDLSIPGGARELEMVVGGRTQIIGQNGRNVKSQLIHLAMHYYGNASNRERLVRGYLGKDATPEQMRDGEADIKRFLDEQIRQGLLTRADFEFMQETFRQLSGADMLGRAQKVMLNLRHYEMTTIEAEKFSIQFPDGEAVEFDGGYIPVRYDTSATGGREGDAQGLQDEDMSIDQQAKRMLSILPSFAKDRTVSPGDPLELNLANIQHHAAEVFRFIHMSEPVTEVYKVVNGADVRRAFIERFGTKAYRNMEGWLKRSAYQKFDSDDRTQVGNLMLTMARNANMGVMFLNIGNALQNYAGLVIPMRRVGARRIISAFISNLFSKGPRIEVAEKSVEMKIRLERQIFDIYNQQQKLLTQESGIWDRIQDWSNRYAYLLQQWTQNHVDVAVWQAAYNQETERALREFMGDPTAAERAEARAVAYADSIVRQTQMAGEKEDVSNFESQGAIYRAMFPFKSWFINWMNNASNQRRLDLDKQGQAKAAALASSYMYLLMLPAMLATAATELARGEDFDDEDDGYGDDMFELWFRSQVEQVTGGLPLVTEATRVMDTFWFDDQYWNNRYPATPWQRVVENIAKAPLKKDAIDATGALASQLADLMGVPASRVWKTVNLLGDEFIREDLESESTYDFLRGAVTGQRSDLQRLSQ